MFIETVWELSGRHALGVFSRVAHGTFRHLHETSQKALKNILPTSKVKCKSQFPQNPKAIQWDLAKTEMECGSDVAR